VRGLKAAVKCRRDCDKKDIHVFKHLRIGSGTVRTRPHHSERRSPQLAWRCGERCRRRIYKLAPWPGTKSLGISRL
jgi:hypothetical protein